MLQNGSTVRKNKINLKKILLNFNGYKLITTLIVLGTVFSASSSFSKEPQNEIFKKPKLVLQITVDQLRGDLPFRYRDRFVEGGFNYLLNKGTVYRDAHHAHANTETIVGHATLATGAYPSSHGLVGNIWYDRNANTTVYNIEDANYTLLTKNSGVDKSTEIDPTQKAAKVQGRSPQTISSSTFSDEILISSAGKAKVFGVSVKDRGAVSMAGHGGNAFWFSKSTQKFVSSSYYYDRYPNWVNEWNKKKHPAKYLDKKWSLLNKKATYLFADKDDNQWEMDLAGYGKVFPHAFGHSKYFSTLLTVSPVGDELTANFAKKLIENEAIGQDDITDYLSISFSSTDYIGHFFGSSSLEMEDNLLRLDRTLADLFSYIDKNIGLENTLIVLSSDHGGPEAPGYLQEQKLQGQYISAKSWDEVKPIKALKKNLGISEVLIEAYHHPYIYLDHQVIKKHQLALANVQDEVSNALATLDDVYQTVASNKIESGLLADTKVNNAVSKNYFSSRSGDIYVVFKPQDFINNLDGLKVTATHGSVWTYDTFVPVIFAGMDIPAQHVFRRIETVDVAPTLSALISIKAPSASEGEILEEVFK